MIFIWISIALFGLMDVLGFISIIQEHRKNKKDYARGLSVGHELAKRQFQPLKDRWEKLKRILKINCDAVSNNFSIVYSIILEKMEELEDGSDTNVGGNGDEL